jgi:hypothetical protein
MIHICQATTAEEREAVYRFRYIVYVEELGRYIASADHLRKLLIDPEDERSWNYYAHDGSEIVASYRITWGRHGFSQRQIHQYGLRPFLAELPERVLFVGERTMVAAAHRGASVMAALAGGVVLPVADEDHGLVFGACEPHLVPYYADLDTVPYAANNVNSDESGYLIPLVAFPHGVEALDGLGSGPGTPRCVQRVLDGDCAVRTASIAGEEAFGDELDRSIKDVREEPSSFFAGLTDAEVRRCTERSSIIDCAPGDRVIRRGTSTRSLFVVLDGHLEAREGGEAVARLTPGGWFGEAPRLDGRAQHGSIVAIDPATRVLCLSAKVLADIADREPPLAAKLRANLERSRAERSVDGGAGTSIDVASHDMSVR